MTPLALLLACAPDSTDDTASAAADVLPVAALAELSSGECPDLTAPGTSTFVSGGEERTVTVLFPADKPAGMPLVFFFQGLMSPDYTPQPTEYMANALDLQDLADETQSIIVLPESRIWEMYTYTFYMWEIFDQDDLDLVLFDDLRTCMARELQADLMRVPALGFSGGALFTTVVARERGDALSAVVEMSGGSDIESSFFPDIGSWYDTPDQQMPALLWSGGEQDVWPDPSLAVVDFVEATDTLQGKLVADGHFTVRCTHERGHTITQNEFDSAQAWAFAHTFGEPSPYETEGIDTLPGDCALAE